MFGVAIGASALLAQSHSKTQAANTISSNYQVIEIGGTTDGLPPNASMGGTGGLYEYNINANSIVRIDVSTTGVPANGPIASGGVGVSETGRYVTFSAHATNLIDGTTMSNTNVNVLQHDVQAGTTTSFLTRYDAAGSASQSPEVHLGVSNDGRFVLMASRYIHYAYPYPYVMLYGDNKTGSEDWTVLGTGTDSADNPGTDTETAGRMSCDGSLVLFQHGVTIQLFDARNDTTTPVSLTTSSSINPSISCNGRYILYATLNRTDITPTPTGMNSNYHLVRYDRITGERSYIDSNSTGTFSISSILTPSRMTYDYFSASVADTGDVALRYNNNIYLKHLSDGSGTLEPIAKNTSGGAVVVNNGPTSISADGRYVLFQADPYTLGLASSPAGIQTIRVRTGL